MFMIVQGLDSIDSDIYRWSMLALSVYSFIIDCYTVYTQFSKIYTNLYGMSTFSIFDYINIFNYIKLPEGTLTAFGYVVLVLYYMGTAWLYHSDLVINVFSLFTLPTLIILSSLGSSMSKPTLAYKTVKVFKYMGISLSISYVLSAFA